MIRRLASNESGFTMMELVWAMVLGIIVLLASFTVMDRAFLSNRQISDREDALQRGRNALEQVTRQLRSGVCIGYTNPITAGTPSSVTFYTYLGDPTNAATQNPEQHVITFSGSTITEQDFKITSMSPLTVSSTSYRGAKWTNVAQATDPSTGLLIPVFQYYKFTPTGTAGTGSYTALSTPVSATDLNHVAKVTVTFLVKPTSPNATAARLNTNFTNDVVWRAADPDNPTKDPCAPTS
jgi:Tfp pilus assembly protein PilW